MNGYVAGGYVVSIGSLLAYGISLAVRERSARRRMRPAGTDAAPNREHPGGGAGEIG